MQHREPQQRQPQQQQRVQSRAEHIQPDRRAAQSEHIQPDRRAAQSENIHPDRQAPQEMSRAQNVQRRECLVRRESWQDLEAMPAAPVGPKAIRRRTVKEVVERPVRPRMLRRRQLRLPFLKITKRSSTVRPQKTRSGCARSSQLWLQTEHLCRSHIFDCQCLLALLRLSICVSSCAHAI